jgi:hypothetical protein
MQVSRPDLLSCRNASRVGWPLEICNQIRSGGSYLSQNDFRVHFGLGDVTRIDSLEIHWPSGSTDVVRNLAADQFYSILEGKGVVLAGEIRPRSPARP